MANIEKIYLELPPELFNDLETIRSKMGFRREDFIVLAVSKLVESYSSLLPRKWLLHQLFRK
jgi:hypothetical protein